MCSRAAGCVGRERSDRWVLVGGRGYCVQGDPCVTICDVTPWPRIAPLTYPVFLWTYACPDWKNFCAALMTADDIMAPSLFLFRFGKPLASSLPLFSLRLVRA